MAKKAKPKEKKSTISKPSLPEKAIAAVLKTRPAKRTGLKKLFGFRFIRHGIAILAFLAMLPVVLMLVYAIPGTKPISTLMLGRWVTGQSVDRQWKNIDDIADVLPQSIIMSEDGQFCNHRGVDWRELNSVIDDALDGEKTRGASTLPMQVSKNLFLWPSRSFVRKVLEIPLAIIADLIWSKKRMMEIYLNIAEWDEGVFGAGAASQHYFKIDAGKLNRSQAALLTVSLPNPVERNPAKPGKGLKKLAQRIEKRAQQSGAYVQCLK